MSKPTNHFPRKAELPDAFATCANDAIAASTRNVSNLADASYWAAVCPELTVEGKFKGAKPLVKPLLEEACKQQLQDEGVFQLPPTDFQWPVNVHKLAVNMAVLMQHGWPATFLIMFDEVWALIQRASALMAGASGGNACNMDVLCWYVDPNRGAAGFSPHRDRQPDDSPATFRPDGSPMYSTCWVPLTDACPENSCLYMVPRWADPGYFDGDDDDGPDPLTVALSSKEAFQAIRAFPAEAGSAIMFSHRIIHWGSRGRKGYHTPRLAVSWGCADDAYEPPYFSRRHLPYPPMELRAALACGQMLVYHERFDMSRRQLSLYYKYFMSHAAGFHPSYRDKVMAEFVAASREAVGSGPMVAVPGTPAGGGMKAAMAGAAPKAAVGNGHAAEVAVEGKARRKADQQREEGKELAEEEDDKGNKNKKKKKEKQLQGGGVQRTGGGDEGKQAEVRGACSEEGAVAATKPVKQGKRAAAAGDGIETKASSRGEGAAGPAGKRARKEKAAAPTTAIAEVSAALKKGKQVLQQLLQSPASDEEDKAAKTYKDRERGKKNERSKGKQETAAGRKGFKESDGECGVAGAVVAKKAVKAAEKKTKAEDSSDEDQEDGEEALMRALGTTGGQMDSEDELMEDALDAMLEAELAGKDLAPDDFDDYEDDGEEEDD